MEEKTYITLVSDEHKKYLFATLYNFSQELFRQPPNILILNDVYTAELAIEIELHYKYYCYQNHKYSLTNMHCPINIYNVNVDGIIPIISDSLEPLVLLIPEHISQDGDELVLSMTETQMGLLEVLEENNYSIHEGLLKEIFNIEKKQLTKLSLTTIFSQINELSQKLVYFNLSLDNLWESELGRFYLMFLDMKLWRFGLMSRGGSILIQAIKQIMKSDENWMAHLVLLLYKRYYSNIENKLYKAPDWFQKIFRHNIENNGRHLEILPPIKDFRVAIFMPTYNRSKDLKEAIECVLSQTYTDWVLYIVDDNSTDNTKEIVSPYLKKHANIHYILKKENWGFLGILKSWRKLIDSVDVELFTSLADDDRWTRNHLEICMQLFQSYPWLSMVYTSMQVMQNREILVNTFGPFQRQKGLINNQEELFNAGKAGLCPVGFVFRKNLVYPFEKHDVTSKRLFNDTYFPWDYMFHVKLISHYEVAHIPDYTVIFNVNEGTGSVNWDWVNDLLYLITELVHDYFSLYQQPYPQAIFDDFMHHRLMSILHQLSIALNENDSEEELDSFVESKKQVWKNYIKTRNKLKHLIK